MKLVSVLAAIICFFAATKSLAQIPGKLSGPRPAVVPNRKMSDDDKARQVTNDFARCIVKRNAHKVKLALERPVSAEAYLALGRFVDSECLSSGELRMPPTILRGAFFRALYLRDFGKQAPVGQNMAVNYAGEAGNDAVMLRLATLKAFGSCVAKVNPQASRALVLSDVASVAEADAISLLRPALADCLKDGTLKLSKGVLQGNIAEVLYREAPRVVTVNAGSAR